MALGGKEKFANIASLLSKEENSNWRQASDDFDSINPVDFSVYHFIDMDGSIAVNGPGIPYGLKFIQANCSIYAVFAMHFAPY